MADKGEIDRFVARLTSEFGPERVVLFGSRSAGRPSKDSDVDLLVVIKHGLKNSHKALEIRRRIARSFPLDLLVRKPDEIRRRLKEGDVFLTSILQNGVTLYEKAG